MIAKARRFESLPEETRGALRFYLEQRPAGGSFDRDILAHQGCRACCTKGPRIKALKRLIGETLVVLDGNACSFELESIVIPVVDLAKATQLVYASPLCAELLSKADEPRPYYANWVPDIVSGIHGRRSTDPRTSTSFRNGGHILWEFFVDGGRLYSGADDAGSLGINVFATCAQFPLWYRERTEAWLWLSTIPSELVWKADKKTRGEKAKYTLPALFAAVVARFQRRVAGGVTVWDSYRKEARVVHSHIGFVEADMQAEYDLLGLKRRYSNCRHCDQARQDLCSVGAPVVGLQDLKACPNSAPLRGWRAVEVLLAQAGPQANDLRSWLPPDTMHVMYADGLLARLVQITFGLKKKDTPLPPSWLTPWQRKLASIRITRATGMTPWRLFWGCLETKRRLCAFSAWAVEGLVRSAQGLRHLKLLVGAIALAAEEERQERLLDRIPQMRDLAQEVVHSARELYGQEFCNRGKVHRLLHLYEGTAGKAWSPSHGARYFRMALTWQKPPLRHYSMWRGERLQKHAKRAARAIYKAKRDRSGRNTRFLRVQNVEAQRTALLRQQLHSSLSIRPSGPPDEAVTPHFVGVRRVSWIDLGCDRSCVAGEWWLVRRPVLGLMRFRLARIESVFVSRPGADTALCYHAHVKLFQEVPQEAGPPRVEEEEDPAAHIEVPVQDLVEEVHIRTSAQGGGLRWLMLAPPA